MRHTSPLLKLFPPPNFLTMPHAGLEISDDAIRCIEYTMTSHGFAVSKFARTELPLGLLDGGAVKDEKKFAELLSAFARANKLSYVKVSLPEEKVYLFQVDIPSTNVRAIEQTIEFKLEENVPLAASDAVFYFDILPALVTGKTLRASVSVVSKTYVEKYIALLRSMSMIPMAFEVSPKSIARATIPPGSEDTIMIVHTMNKKTGIYIVFDGVVNFSSTIAWGTRLGDVATFSAALAVDPLLTEIRRVHTYWATRPDAQSPIAGIILAGRDAGAIQPLLHAGETNDLPPASVADVWHNAFDVNAYIPPISHEESLEYAVAAGLALPLS